MPPLQRLILECGNVQPESTWRCERRARQADSSKDHSKTRAFNYWKICRVNLSKRRFPEMFEMCWSKRQAQKPG